MSKLYFYKLRSPYKGDVTKNCKLSIEDIDNNFLQLKDDDIAGAYLEGNNIVLKRNNGDLIKVDISTLKSDVNVDYDSKNGVITITHNGVTDIVDGIVTRENIGEIASSSKDGGVFTDATLQGDGRQRRPLGISPVERTGMYAPALKIIDMVDSSSTLPSPKDMKKGDRFVTKENVNPYGLLYNHYGVFKISKDLNHGWRVPSKSDWDDMLNSVEPCDEFRNHGEKIGNHILGKYAGKVLKSTEYWNQEDIMDDPFDFDEEHQYPHGPNNHDDRRRPKPKPVDPSGTDTYGFNALPAGYGDGNKFMGYFGDRTEFWTMTRDGETDVYTKRFDYNKSGVVQILENPNALCSLRLVKDYDGHNFTGVEFINGMAFKTVLMPSDESPSGFRIWTADNVSFNDTRYGGVEPNGGELLDTQIGYFVNEWDGFRWYKKRMADGEQIVVINGNKENEEKDYTQYILINGSLVPNSSQSSGTTQEEIDEIRKEIDGINKSLEEGYATNDKVDGAYTELNDSITQTNKELQNLNELVKEITGESSETIEKLKDNVITGGTYDNQSGNLTLNKVNGHVVIKFDGNYGSMEG